MKKFRKGQEYSYVGWFTGGQIFLRVISIKGNKVVFSVGAVELDGNHSRRETHDIRRDADGNEFFVPQSYRGSDCVIYADDVEGD